MSQIKILIADSHELIREGVKAVLKRAGDMKVVAEAAGSSDLRERFHKNSIDVLIIDYSQPGFDIEDIRTVITNQPQTKILAMTGKCEKTAVESALKAGLNGHILYCCDRNEMADAIRSVARGDKFYCGKVLDVLNGSFPASSCAPVALSPREIQIISLVADGLSNKQIADKLFLSAHTVMTHRKNIMNKLGVNNTAGIVMYAVKENIINPNKYLFAQEMPG